MLSDEEKEAINRLYDVTHLTNGEHTEYIDIDNIATEEEYLDSCEGFCKATDIVLNLIEKQSKEIEEYNKQLDLDYVDKHFVPIERYNQLEKEIEELKLKIGDEKTFIQLGECIGEKKVKDKIKAKIEELEKQDREDRMSHNYLVIPVLQSLLEKER